MPATRWTQSLNDLLNWFEEDFDIQGNLILKPITPKIMDKNDHMDKEKIAEEGDLTAQIPTLLPILPLRGVVVYPQTAVPLTIGQSRSIRLVDDVMAGDERLIG